MDYTDIQELMAKEADKWIAHYAEQYFRQWARRTLRECSKAELPKRLELVNAVGVEIEKLKQQEAHKGAKTETTGKKETGGAK